MRRPAAAGFTLLEIAVALAILGVGVVTCLELFGQSLRLQSRALRQVEAVGFARSVMDRLLLDHNRDDDEPPRYRRGDCPAAVQESAAAAGGMTARCWSEACPLAPSGDEDAEPVDEGSLELRCLRVEVSWQDGAGVKQYVLASRATFPRAEDF